MKAWKALALFALALSALDAHAVSPARRPNIVFILADDLGYGELSCYGQEKYRTPRLDRMAAEGMRFTQHYACPTCAPSRSALLTGLHSGHTPIRSLGGFKTLAADDLTLGEMFKGVGYATGIFGKWGLGYQDNPGRPTLHGFDEFFGQLHHIHAHFQYPYFLWKNDERFLLPENEGHRQARYAHDEIHAQAKKFIRAHAGEAFFAYIAYTIPHIELVVPDDSMRKYQGRWPRVSTPALGPGYFGAEDSLAAFAGMVDRLDQSVGEILDLLRELKIDENTLVIFTSDNGPQGEQWREVADFFSGAGPLRGYKNQFLEGGMRVPMLARWPGRIAGGGESDLLCAVWDYLATFAELSGANAPKNDGLSLLPTLLGHPEAQVRHDFLYWENPQKQLQQAVRWKNWKAISQASGGWALYDLSRDLRELHDVAAEHPEILLQIEDCVRRAARTPDRTYPATPRPTAADFVR